MKRSLAVLRTVMLTPRASAQGCPAARQAHERAPHRVNASAEQNQGEISLPRAASACTLTARWFAGNARGEGVARARGSESRIEHISFGSGVERRRVARRAQGRTGTWPESRSKETL